MTVDLASVEARLGIEARKVHIDMAGRLSKATARRHV